MAPSVIVGPRIGDGTVRIDDGQNPCTERNLFPLLIHPGTQFHPSVLDAPG